jgi:predicted nucleic acid-binding protein
MPRVLPDTNVLFPFSLMDLLLALAEDNVLDLALTERLLDEWQRVIVREGHRTPETAKKIADLIRTGFASCIVPEHTYRQHLTGLEGPDPDDLHHMAAAIAAGADTLITWNLADFPATALAPHGVAVSPPDPYLCALLERYPDQILRTVTRMAAEKKRPPLTTLDLIAKLERAGVPTFAGRLRRLTAQPAA